MPAIVTLTFNPCVDKTVGVNRLIPEKKMHCPPIRLDPGGGGINVARGIKRLGGDVVAIYPYGGYHGQLLTKMLNEEKVPVLPVEIGENIRENWMILEYTTGRQYRFITPGPVLGEDAWNRCLYMLDSVSDLRFIVVSGSMPPDFPKDIFQKICAISVKKNARVIADTSGDALKLLAKSGIYMIKANLNELASLIVAFGLSNESPAAAAKELIRKKIAEVVVVSMGAAGALLVDANTTFDVKSPQVRTRSAAGAGDSMVAGMLINLAGNKTLKEAIAFGVACGAAATMNPGTALFHVDDAENLYHVMQQGSLNFPTVEKTPSAG